MKAGGRPQCLPSEFGTALPANFERAPKPLTSGVWLDVFPGADASGVACLEPDGPGLCYEFLPRGVIENEASLICERFLRLLSRTAHDELSDAHALPFRRHSDRFPSDAVALSWNR